MTPHVKAKVVFIGKKNQNGLVLQLAELIDAKGISVARPIWM